MVALSGYAAKAAAAAQERAAAKPKELRLMQLLIGLRSSPRSLDDPALDRALAVAKPPHDVNDNTALCNNHAHTMSSRLQS